jgi:hypothetical protein
MLHNTQASRRIYWLLLVGSVALFPIRASFGQSAAVVNSNDGHSNQYGTEVVDGFSQTLLSGYAAPHSVSWGSSWTGSGNTQQPQVEPVPPTDVVSSGSYSSGQWSGGSNILGELHASRLALWNMEASLSQMAALAGSGPSSSGSFSSITVSGTTPWGTAWSGQTVPWTQWDSQNLAGCYQTELWIFGALIVLPIVLLVRP